MKKIKLFLVLLLVTISSLFLIRGIYGIFTKVTTPNVNNITIKQKTSYTVIHEIMNIDGSTYTEYSRVNHSDIPIGTTVTPEVLNIDGFEMPSSQTITLDSYQESTIIYRYPRKQYTLTINNSNYVTTTTPSGTYYYGEQIHLVADPTDIEGNTFVKWSNNTNNRDYTFTINKDTIIEPLYTESFAITFETNNGDESIVNYVAQNKPLGHFPSVSYDDCDPGTGDYEARNCTFVNEFEGWYLESTFENKVNEDFVPTEDTTLYAKWRKVFYKYNGQIIFDGTNFIDTGIKLFSEDNINKNFEISFNIVSKDSNQTSQATIVNSMFEKSPYPGFVFRYEIDKSKVEFNAPKIANKSKINASDVNKVVIKRINEVFFIQLNDGTLERIGTYSWSTFNDNTVIGASIDSNGLPWRFFKGVLENIKIIVTDAEEYTVHFDPNGGTGTMENMVIRKDRPATLNTNSFSMEGKIFINWNTKADGTGISYENNESITNIAAPGETLVLYAIWEDGFHYNIRFNSNGGTGSMDNQEHIYELNKNLSTNTFVRDGYIFCGWNTNADGSGTFYKDNQSVINLTKTANDIVDFYAVWAKEEYDYADEYIFDGSNYIDTEIHLFSQATIDKDFDISFEIVSRNTDVYQATMMSAMDESADPWPGLVYRIVSNTQDGVSANATKTTKIEKKINNRVSKILFKRRSGILYISYDDGPDELFLDMTSLSKPFNSPVVFGCSLTGSGTPQRFFSGTLKNMHVKLYE